MANSFQATAEQSGTLIDLTWRRVFKLTNDLWLSSQCRRGDCTLSTCSFGIYILFHFNASHDYKLKPATLRLNVDHRVYSSRHSSAWYEYPSQYNPSHGCCGPPSQRNYSYTTTLPSLPNEVRPSKYHRGSLKLLIVTSRVIQDVIKPAIKTFFKTFDTNPRSAVWITILLLLFLRCNWLVFFWGLEGIGCNSCIIRISSYSRILVRPHK